MEFIVEHSIRHKIRPESMEPVEDLDYFLNLMAHGIKIRYISKPLYLYRITPGSAFSCYKRIAMMKTVLKNSIENFKNNPNSLVALQEKIEVIDREELYMSFILAIKNRDFTEVLKIINRCQWVIPEFVSRLYRDIVYHTHRIRHGGRVRGIRF